VDVILWDGNPREFIRNALSPAKVGLIEVGNEGREASVTVTPDQLSLAIGKGGQNVRLAAKLTHVKIDLRETAAISDLDAAMQQAMHDGVAAPENSAAQSAFDALFKDSKSVATASPDDLRD
jgi:N utilization substance protein A